MCGRKVPEEGTFLEPDGDRVCVNSWKCASIAMMRLGISRHRAEREARRLYPPK